MKRALLLSLALLPFTALAQQPAAPAYEPKPIEDEIYRTKSAEAATLRTHAHRRSGAEAAAKK